MTIKINNQQSSSDNVKKWTCHPGLCFIKQDMINGVGHFLHKIHETKGKDCTEFYTHKIDKCSNPGGRSDKLGHPLHCCFGDNCKSLLRPARVVSCHFPFLRNIVYRTYELRRLGLFVLDVRSAMQSGDFMSLKAALDALQTHLHKTDNRSESVV